MANPSSATPGMGRLAPGIGIVSALVAGTCCLLPLVLSGLGLAGAGLMMTMMAYTWLTLPLGTVGLAGALVLYTRARRCGNHAECGLLEGRLGQAILGLASMMVISALLLRLFPSWTSRLLQLLL